MAAPSAGNLRVGRYFTALILLLAVLYSVVAFGSTHKPKLGLDLVGGIRVVFTAITPQGSAQPTSSQMDQARQILEDRIDTTGVTGATVVVQGSDQLIVEIPNGTSTDLANLGSAAILNFRGLTSPPQTLACVPVGATTTTGTATGSASASPSGTASGTTSGAASSTGAAASPEGSGSNGALDEPSTRPATQPAAAHTARDAAARPLAKASTTSKAGAAKSSAAKTSAAKSAAKSSAAKSAAKSSAAKSAAKSSAAKASATPTGVATSAAPSASASTPTATTCLANPFSNAKSPATVRALKAELISTYKITATNPTIANVLPNAETCPSPGIAAADCRAYSTLSTAEQAAITTGLQSLDCTSTQTEPDLVTGAYYACDTTDDTASLLGHVIVKGTQIDSADAQAPSTSGTGDSVHWTVALTLTSGGGSEWSAWTGKYNTTDQGQTAQSCSATGTVECSLFVGFTLDGQVIATPITLGPLGTQTSITGNYTEGQAKSLAQQLSYGKLPISFRADDTQSVSATLGSKQLKAAFLAGGIGLALVVLYSLIYYRALGFVTIASLIVSAGLTYALLVILGKQLGFTLDLAGIAGFIVALGITADSFVVFFERLKDEVHEGRSARVAVPRAWTRARRTILSADTVSFLAAAILYYFASADVKGFAFTLGMSTILDLVVVFLFTHPLVAWLSRFSAFGSRRFTGLDAVRGGPAVSTDPRPRRRPSAPKAAGGVVVLDKPETYDDLEDGVDQTPVDDISVYDSADVDIIETRTVHDRAAEDGAADEAGDGADGPTRRRSAPQAGSAAERAAARRARIREQRDNGGGDSGSDSGEDA